MRWAAANRVLITADEVQSGMGRTGRMFAFEHYGITPDLVACGKGLSSSLPVSAVIGRQEIHGPCGPRGNVEHVRRQSGLRGRGPGLSGYYRQQEPGGAFGKIGKATGAGAGRCCGAASRFCANAQWARAVPFDPFKRPPNRRRSDHLTDDIVMRCVRRGVLMFLTGRGFFKLVPPLTIDPEALWEAVGEIGAVMDEVLRPYGR